MNSLALFLKGRASAVERALQRCAGAARFGTPALAEASRYALFSGGKRVRPALVLAAAEACGGDATTALPAACAFELVHTYSLIHDDLPSMDDDDVRRGRPTVHKAFGEALAVLAGDALLTRAFGVIADAGRRGPLTAPQAVELVALLAEAAGGPGMVGGQVLDIADPVSGFKGKSAQLLKIHRMKTGALIAAAAEAGAVSAGAPAAKRKALRSYGESLGLAFQIVDDLLDAGDENGKMTYPAVYGLERSRAEADRQSRRAVRALAGFGPAASPLRLLAESLPHRER